MVEFFIRLAAFVGQIVSTPQIWIALLILAACGILVALYRQAKLRALDKVVYNRHFSTDGIFVGETLELIETIRNPGWLPLFRVRVEFFMPGGLTVDGIECKKHTKVTSIFHIPPHATVQKVHTVRADKRDHYHMYTSFIRYRKNEYTFDSVIDFCSRHLSLGRCHCFPKIHRRPLFPFRHSGIPPRRPDALYQLQGFGTRLFGRHETVDVQ